jgi:uncharacterized small protein (DUF1192 family)
MSGNVMAGAYDKRAVRVKGLKGMFKRLPPAFMLGQHRPERLAMIDEEDGPVRKRMRLEKLVLDTLGIEELRDYIDELKAEIARVEADIGHKQGHRSAADAFFRRP